MVYKHWQANPIFSRRRDLPMKSMCSRKWANPGTSLGFCMDPTATFMTAELCSVFVSWIKMHFSLLGSCKN